MGKKKGTGKREEATEKVITGSGADIVSHEDEQGKVKCKCVVPCVWRGYRDEGDTVWIEREMIEKDAFIRAHFKAVEELPEGRRGQDVEEAPRGEGAAGTVEEQPGGRRGQDVEEAPRGEGAAGTVDLNGQGELGLK